MGQASRSKCHRESTANFKLSSLLSSISFLNLDKLPERFRSYAARLGDAQPFRMGLCLLNHGAQMGWLIDPDKQTVFVYLPKQQPEVFDGSGALTALK